MEQDPAALADIIKRLRRVQGQIGGIIQMMEDGRECSDVLTQIAAASRALDRAGFKVVASALRECMSRAEGTDGSAVTEQELERLFMSLA